MANAELRLKVSKASYEEKISLLQNYLTRLDSTITDYQTAERELDSFMDGSDDNYESLRENVRANIQTVQKSREMCDASIKMLQQTLQEMDDFGQNAKSTIENSISATKSAVKAAVQAAKLIN